MLALGQSPVRARLTGLALIAAGAALAVAALTYSWGSCAFSASGLLLIAGMASTAGGDANGWRSTCPSCDCPMSSETLGFARSEPKVVFCWRCKQHAVGTDSLRPMPADYVHPTPAFERALPDDARWPDDCPPELAEIRDGRVRFRSAAAFHAFERANDPRMIAPEPAHKHKDAVADAVPIRDSALTLDAYLKRHPDAKGQLRAPRRCPAHGVPTLTQMGFRSRMDLLPSHEWMEAGAGRPMRLDLGCRLEPPRPELRRRFDEVRLVWCPECEASPSLST